MQNPTVVSVTYRGECYSAGVIEGKDVASHLDGIDQYMKDEKLSRGDACDLVVSVIKGRIKRSEDVDRNMLVILIWLACRGGMGENGKRAERQITEGGHTLINHINKSGDQWDFQAEVYPSDEVDVWFPSGSHLKH